MSIRAKILRGFITVVIIGALLGTIGVVSSQMFTSRARELDKLQHESAKFSEVLNAHYTWRNNLTQTVIAAAEFKGSLDPDTCVLGNWLKSEESKAIEDPQILALLESIKEPHSFIHHNAESIVAMVESGDMIAAQNELTNVLLPRLQEVINGLTAIGARYNEMLSEEVVAMQSLGSYITVLAIVIVIVAVVIALWLAIVISGNISKPLSLLSSFMKKAGETGDLTLRPEDIASIEKFANSKGEIGNVISGSASFIKHVTKISKELELIADGDLTVDLEVLSDSDIVGQSLRKMEGNLNSMFDEIRNSSNRVSDGAKDVSDGAQSLAAGSTQQAESILELKNSISVISEKTTANAAMANKTSELSLRIKDSADKGSRQMDEMITAVSEINEASRGISKIIKTIDDIAIQTNILALNAAVEAARAGSHGKGFSVVAEEVRNLATKSADAAKDTSSMIQNSMEKAELGSRIANETAASLKEIATGINEASLFISEIAAASDEQSTGVSNINVGIDQVAQVVQQNSATAQESAAASEEMKMQSDILQKLISQFNLKESNDDHLGLPQYAAHSQHATYSQYDDTAPEMYVPGAPSMTSDYDDLGKYGDGSYRRLRATVRKTSSADAHF